LLQRVPKRVLDRPEERERHRAQLDLEPKLDAGVDGSRLDAQTDRGEERIRRLAEDLCCGTGADGSFDADRRRLAEADVEAVVARQRRLASPAQTDPRRTVEPLSKTLIAVTFRSPSRPNRSRSRVRTVPENIRTYATFSPAGPRSILKTLPETGSATSRSAAGRSSAKSAMSD